MQNLPTFIQLDRLFQTLKFGRVSFSAKLDDGGISVLLIEANEKRLFNRSEKDKLNNEEALKYVLDRIVSFLEKNQSEKLTIEVFATEQKIRKIEITSQHKIIIDNKSKKGTI